MEDQERSSIRGERLETALIHYVVRDKTNKRSDVPDFYESLGGAVDAYQPDADLLLVIGDRIIEMDIGRDMYGFHRDLLKLAEHICWRRPSDGLYREALRPHLKDSNVYTVVLTDFYEPPILYFVTHEDSVYVQTRTLMEGNPIATDEDVIDFVVYDRQDLLGNFCSFLQRYMQDLGEQLLAVRSLSEYSSYLERLIALRCRSS